MTEAQLVRWTRRLASWVVAAVTVIAGLLLTAPIAEWCCNGRQAADKVVFDMIMASGACIAGLIAERRDAWFAAILAAGVVAIALLGFALSAVERGETRGAELLIFTTNGIVAIGIGYVVASSIHSRAGRGL